MITAHTSAAYLGANIPTGTAAPNTSSIPRQPAVVRTGPPPHRRLRPAGRRPVGDTDGALTVTNLCAEARVSRASYYRSPVAAVVKTLLASDQTPRPEVEQLRLRVRELDKTGKEQRRRHAQEVGDLKAAAAVYANQVQVLALRNAELEPTTAAWSRNWRRWKRL